MTTTNKPLPLIDQFSQPFWEATKDKRFILHHCRSCGRYYFPATVCYGCDNPDMEWSEASGRGTVYSWTTFYQAYHPAFKDDLPYAVVLVKLEEGPFFLSNVTGSSVDDLRVGMPVEIEFESVNSDVVLPKFKAAAERSSSNQETERMTGSRTTR
jgi:uncharacterized protein